VTTAAITDGSVTTPKIANGNVTINHIADNAINAPKIVDANVTNAKLATMAEATIKGRAAGAGTGVPQDLTAAQVTALLPAAPLSYRNILGRNGGFEVWQRGAGGSASFGIAAGAPMYVADGWYIAVSNASHAVVQQSATVTNGSRHSMSVTRIFSETGVAQNTLEFPLDTDEIALARGSIVTLSMSLAALANWSPAGGNIVVSLFIGTGNPARRTSGAYTGETVPINVSQPITGSLTRYSFTSASVIPIATKQASVTVQWTPVGTALANDGFIIDDVQLEIGSVATPFERRPFEQELAACQRYYNKTFPYAIAPANSTGNYAGLATQIANAANSSCGVLWRYPVRMRASPTLTSYNPNANNNNFRNAAGSADYALANVGASGEFGCFVWTTASVVLGDFGIIHATADAGI
jgi:hypothetical protein